MAILVLLSILALLAGFYFLSQATMGVGFLAIACLLAIFARLAQADAHQKEIRNLLGAQRNETEKETPVSEQPKQGSKWGGLNDE